MKCIASARLAILKALLPASFPTVPTCPALIQTAPFLESSPSPVQALQKFTCPVQLPLRPSPCTSDCPRFSLPLRLVTLPRQGSALTVPHLVVSSVTYRKARWPHGAASKRVVFKTSPYTQKVIKISHFYTQSWGGNVEREVIVLKHTEIKKNICCSEFSQYTVSYVQD